MPFWSAAVYARDGRAIASLNDGMAGDAAPDFRVLTRSQMAGSSENGPYALEAEGDAALLTLRVFVPDDTRKPLAEAPLSTLACRTER